MEKVYKYSEINTSEDSYRVHFDDTVSQNNYY